MSIRYILGLILYLVCCGFSLADDQSRNSRDNEDNILSFLTSNATEVEPVTTGLITEEAGEVWLHWTATGDDNLEGRATGYDIRYRGVNYGPINSELRWQFSTQVAGEPTPVSSGQADSMLIAGLVPGESYYFCIRAYDDAGNYSGFSNSPLKTIPGDGLSLTVQVDGMGTVTVSPEKQYYNQNEVVYLYAQPDPEWSFIRWRGSINAYYNPILIYMNSSYTIVADFVEEGDFIAGDPNRDGMILSSDVIYLIQYFRGIGNAPMPLLAGDCNGDCLVIGPDVTYLIYYLRGLGSVPYRGDCSSLILSVDDDPAEGSLR